jgi:hypothetical protein
MASKMESASDLGNLQTVLGAATEESREYFQAIVMTGLPIALVREAGLPAVTHVPTH